MGHYQGAAGEAGLRLVAGGTAAVLAALPGPPGVEGARHRPRGRRAAPAGMGLQPCRAWPDLAAPVSRPNTHRPHVLSRGLGTGEPNRFPRARYRWPPGRTVRPSRAAARGRQRRASVPPLAEVRPLPDHSEAVASVRGTYDAQNGASLPSSDSEPRLRTPITAEPGNTHLTSSTPRPSAST